MKCAKCGAEIKKGKLYCSKCGAEVQIVSADNVMEDEFFLDIQQTQLQESQTDASAQDVTDKKHDPQLHLPLFAAVMGLVLLTVAAFATRIYTARGGQTDAGDYYGQMVASLAASDDKAAVQCMKNQLLQQSEDVDARFWLAWLYGRQNDTKQQIRTLQEILAQDDTNAYACRELIRIYAATDDFDTLHQLYDTYGGTKLAGLFHDYLVEPPEILAQKEPMWEEDTVAITAADGLNVYYTLDASSPITNGTLYVSPFSLAAGTYTIAAVACNEQGYYSTIVEQKLTVEKRRQLGMPQVTPRSGEYGSPQTIYVSVPEGCTAYYTWNGSVPTTASNKYAGGIAMPEGNNVLSVILVDAYGNVSSIQRMNYIYMPQ